MGGVTYCPGGIWGEGERKVPLERYGSLWVATNDAGRGWEKCMVPAVSNQSLGNSSHPSATLPTWFKGEEELHFFVQCSIVYLVMNRFSSFRLGSWWFLGL